MMRAEIREEPRITIGRFESGLSTRKSLIRNQFYRQKIISCYSDQIIDHFGD